MNSKELRKEFLNFFNEHSHPVIPSSPLIPYGDPSLLFTSAGMVQFKPYYLGLKSDMKRATSCQKCFRTTDIDNVGKTIRHLTFFEMLGNFSFGDYFKEESLTWGYEFLTKRLSIDPNRLYFSIYKGGVAPRDEEAFNIWKKILPSELHSHIFEMGEDNFWSMGDTGPSGPCSEIYYDRGEEFSHDGCLGPSCGCDRYIEIWNHVFTQFDRQSDGSFKPLPKKNIDTGMGLERLCFIVENKFSPFETSLFYPIIKEFINKNFEIFDDRTKIYFESVEKYVNNPDDFNKNIINSDAFKIVPNLRIISDHLRASSFLISEGILPSNEGRGYILRRLIRRAMRYSMLLGVKEPSLFKLVDSVESIFGDVYPQITENKSQIKEVIRYEEEGFLSTLENGEKYIDELISVNKCGVISGAEAFKIYETYGFPYELIKEIALKNNIRTDDEEFIKARKNAQEVSRNWKGLEKDVSIFHRINGRFPKTNFTGYEKINDSSKLLSIISLDGKELDMAGDGEVWLVFEKTPFYAESGGQVGDTGVILENGNIVAEITDVQKPLGDVFYHRAILKSPVSVKKTYYLSVNSYRRRKIESNHTSVHIVNAALKQIFGPNTVQAGSLVNDGKFRFDYTISKTPTSDEIIEVERIANDAIIKGYKVYKEERPLADAKVLGATVLPGEKYSDPARFVLINNDGFKNPKDRYSLELCGGTHVSDLKDVFKIKILKDSSVSRGVRRIEGVSGYSLIEYFEKRDMLINKISKELEAGDDEIIEKINRMKNEIKELKVKMINMSSSSAVSDEVFKSDGKPLLAMVKIPQGDLKIIRSISDKKRKEYKNSFIFVYSFDGDLKKINFVISKTDDNHISVKEIYDRIKKEIDLKAGGRDDFMQGGGNIETEDRLKKVLSKIIATL
ncbi:MAG: alanine--tRNA ligase [Elusimicrobia bacterium]|nr:alanine--tRNA ligase [Elusimicrobiota bacterium]